ncbi:Pkinase-domain-containing protein [Cryphonectria parasitica EP155]|uniref:non-specific serine/threonine protein kinase n=1 Tax=Cryphonectria parasitica (strain ATCC 38755 / EP155) TaxID=660469 RepID=A0A9P4Y771_CRYP1|nr:Pkinase-domain-containing protein [Cryphonectria parasitica EP155]KAF3767756.1 Pkinase-domain-containing protein [Cryphonectria parasitica EP155]
MPEQAGNAPTSTDDSVGPTVRFNSTVQEINPQHCLSQSPPSTSQDDRVGEVTPEDLKALSKSLQGNRLQEKRMNIFSFEAYSLPASRVPSHDDSSRDPSRQQTQSSTSIPSPRLAPRGPEVNSPPLTPSGTDGTSDAKVLEQQVQEEKRLANDVMTPQDSNKRDTSPRTSSRTLPHRPASDGPHQRRPTPEHLGAPEQNHRKSMFSLGPGSLPASRDSSPNRASAHYTRPFTPSGDANDPYSASKRQPQGPIEPRFVFSRSKKGSKVSPSSSTLSLPRASTDKRSSTLLSALGKNSDLHKEDSHGTTHSRQASMSDLKRFFKMGHHKPKRGTSPAASIRSGYKTPPVSRSSTQIPFGDDHGLTSKYGKLGRVLGSGAGGSVRLMKRSEDNTVFAVKEFRPRHSYETEKEYVKKLTAEYCIGSSLHHGNIIETLDIVQEKGKWFEVMEYAPFDLFAIVMTGKMSREEVSCCFLQILSGVTYLHSMGLAHRDLKLDNVVVNEYGIMKIIDFGSAHVFKYPFENNMVLASGIVGSDPYLAPEVYEERKYDPTAVDIWSLAIIYCCMTLRRFPWKVPRMTDNSYKLFASEPTPGHDPKKLVLPPNKSTSALHDTPPRDFFIGEDDRAKHRPHSQHEKPRESSTTTSENPAAGSTGSTGASSAGEKPKEVIRGPWRILRLLPRESRHIIGRMLEIDPKKRAKMAEILDDNWVSNTVICRQVELGKVIKAEDHVHTLEPPSAAPSSTK